jgi:hypothetical protein
VVEYHSILDGNLPEIFQGHPGTVDVPVTIFTLTRLQVG